VENQPLHPNLARLAASYDDIMKEWALHRLSDEEANTKIAALVARDDNGVQWRISSVSGNWERNTKSHGWVEGVPPTFGLATPTARDFTDSPDGFNPDASITFLAVNERKIYDPASLTGATRELRSQSEAPRYQWSRRSQVIAGAAAAIVVIAAAVTLH
jgi:hypothetical protein